MATIMSFSSGGGTRRCDARCHEATRPKCECICGGRYHGCAVGKDFLPEDIIDAEYMVHGFDENVLTTVFDRLYISYPDDECDPAPTEEARRHSNLELLEVAKERYNTASTTTL